MESKADLFLKNVGKNNSTVSEQIRDFFMEIIQIENIQQ